MKKGGTYEGKVIRTDFPCRGIVEAAGKDIAVKDALPGQEVRFRIKKMKSGAGEGRLLEVLERSPLETESSCPHFPACGGCVYQTLPYEEQLRLKEEQLRRLLKPAIDYPFDFEGVRESPVNDGYRNKMEFTFGDEYRDGPLALGMHKRGGFYDIVTTDGCRIADDDFGRILSATLKYFTAADLPYYHRMRHTGYLRHLLVRKAAATGEILVSLVTTTQVEPDLAPWTESLLGLHLDGRFAGILHTYNDSLADTVCNEHTEVMYGRDFFYEEILGLRFKISSFSFFQTNSKGAEVLYSVVRDYTGDTKGRVVYDLYSGTGTIAQILAPVAEKVIGVEIVEEAVEAARENAAMNGLKNCEFIAGDVLKVLDSLTERPELIVFDPPRDGVHPKALRKIIGYGVERMVYVSCKPTSLVRDLEMLQAAGYRVERCCGVDMFPGTANVETVILLSQRKADAYVEVNLELSDQDLTSVETKAALPDREEGCHP